MTPVLTFIIAVKHPENASDWATVKQRLRETMASISAQDNSNWKAVIVANDEADLPEMLPGFSVVRVSLPPNPFYNKRDDMHAYYTGIRNDKGRKVLAGMVHAGATGHLMIVDDDDFISRRITSLVAANPKANGWFIRDGYIWGDGGVLLYRYADFSRLCGTSHIIRSDLYKVPARIEDAEEKYIHHWLGSHISLHDHLDATHNPLEPLPFIGAIYRIGHSSAHSNSPGLLREYILRKHLLRKPLELARRLARLRYKTQAIKKEFFGA